MTWPTSTCRPGPHQGLVSGLPAAGHYSPEDAPDAVTALVRLFLDATAEEYGPAGSKAASAA